jgi:hypothetical protein
MSDLRLFTPGEIRWFEGGIDTVGVWSGTTKFKDDMKGMEDRD